MYMHRYQCVFESFNLLDISPTHSYTNKIIPLSDAWTVHCSLLVFPLIVHADPYTAVRDLIVVIISTSYAKVQWNHTDECEMTDHYEFVFVDFTGGSVIHDTTKKWQRILLICKKGFKERKLMHSISVSVCPCLSETVCAMLSVWYVAMAWLVNEDSEYSSSWGGSPTNFFN